MYKHLLNFATFKMNVLPSVRPEVLKSRDPKICLFQKIIFWSSAEVEDRNFLAFWLSLSVVSVLISLITGFCGITF